MKSREESRKILEMLMNCRGFTNKQSRRAMLQLACLLDVITNLEYQIGMAVVRKTNDEDVKID